jgi:hypothetical protein
MTIGLPYFREGRFLLLPWMLIQPALETSAEEPGARRGGE